MGTLPINLDLTIPYDTGFEPVLIMFDDGSWGIHPKFAADREAEIREGFVNYVPIAALLEELLTFVGEDQSKEALTSAAKRNLDITRALNDLYSAGRDLSTGISVHNALHADAPARRHDIEGPVVSAFRSALHNARSVL